VYFYVSPIILGVFLFQLWTK